MKSVTTTYPGFHELPKGIKQLLLISESFFFGEAGSAPETADAVPDLKRRGTAFPAALHEAFGPHSARIIATVILDCGGKSDATPLSNP